jgi:hypothetical protein
MNCNMKRMLLLFLEIYISGRAYSAGFPSVTSLSYVDPYIYFTEIKEEI